MHKHNLRLNALLVSKCAGCRSDAFHFCCASPLPLSYCGFAMAVLNRMKQI